MTSPLSRPRTPAEREAARARFVRRYGMWRFGAGTGSGGALLFFALTHRPFRWPTLWSGEFALTLAIWLPVSVLWAGRRWGAAFHDRMRDEHGWTPPEE